MSAVSSLSSGYVAKRLVILIIIQFIALALGLALPILVAYLFDSLSLSLTYFSCPYLLIGLYVCPSLIGLSLPITIYYQLQQNVSYTWIGLTSLLILIFSRINCLSPTIFNWDYTAGQ